jgi:hypothetical protein
MLLIQLGGTRLRHELDRVPLWRGNHVSIKQLIDDFAIYLYLPRLRDEDVLIAAIRDGLGLLTWQSETFAYAEIWDEQKQQYKGLQAGQSVRVLADGKSLLVKPDVAAVQMEAEKKQSTAGGIEPVPGATTTLTPDSAIHKVTSTTPEIPVAPVPRRFHGSVKLDPVRIGRDAGRIGEEVVQHLSGLVGANVEVTLEIQASIPDGAPEKTVRDVTENCRTLKFDSYGFEED